MAPLHLAAAANSGRSVAGGSVAAANLATQPAVHVPEVRSELTTSRLLVMERLDGVSVRDVERLDAAGVERSGLADLLLRCFLQQILVDGVFHADPHPGNVLVLADGRLGLLDFGAVGHLDSLQQAAVRDMLVAIRSACRGTRRRSGSSESASASSASLTVAGANRSLTHSAAIFWAVSMSR